ncbi:MAG: hypothetical protein AMQ22_00050 [Candidatus Methanofastidiosum methylothiophilum]|uniref:Uncharacterized protein n=1 Tax=Candidatus Methanofastidiosum methylothiophilum TaxID=1705564 RepID=A0A150J9G8_9EURY|nr:MAG: hypothetical protein AMQ22_00050 [Candidatus Methanofastidiosum methylthiophilus]
MVEKNIKKCGKCGLEFDIGLHSEWYVLCPECDSPVFEKDEDFLTGFYIINQERDAIFKAEDYREFDDPLSNYCATSDLNVFCGVNLNAEDKHKVLVVRDEYQNYFGVLASQKTNPSQFGFLAKLLGDKKYKNMGRDELKSVFRILEELIILEAAKGNITKFRDEKFYWEYQ